MRFTLRRIMIVAAVTFVPVVPIWLYIITHPLEKLFGNTYYGATNSVTKIWDAGPTPKIDVDLYAGYISVVQSTDGRAAAVITTAAIFKNAQSGADAAVAGIVLTTDHEGDTIRIRATNPRNLHAFNLQTDVALRVPSRADLDLLTGEGYVHIGQRLGGGRYGSEWVSSPVALKSVKARDLGHVFTGMEAEILSEPSSPETVLDLESRRGSIRIKGNNLLVNAKADGGGIEFIGRPAPGRHSFAAGPFADHADGGWRLATGIRLIVPADMAFKVDDLSASGQVGRRFTFTSDTPRKPGVLADAVGADPNVRIDLRSDNGPIGIFKDAGGEATPGAGKSR